MALTVRDSLVAQKVRSLPAMWETQVQPLGWKNPLEKETATHTSILAWKITWTEEPGRLQSTRSQRVDHDLSNFISFPDILSKNSHSQMATYGFICTFLTQQNFRNGRKMNGCQRSTSRQEEGKWSSRREPGVTKGQYAGPLGDRKLFSILTVVVDAQT